MLDLQEPANMEEVFDAYLGFKQVLKAMEWTAEDILSRYDFSFTRNTINLDINTFKEHVYGNGDTTNDSLAVNRREGYDPDLQRSNQLVFTRFQLPSNFKRLERSYRQMYERNYNITGYGIENPTDWIESIDWGYSFKKRFRINTFDKTLDIQEPILFRIQDLPGRGQAILPDTTVTLNIIQNAWLMKDNNPIDKITVQDGDAIPMFDREILYYGTKYRWMLMKGYPEAEDAKMEYEIKLSIKIQDDKPQNPYEIGGRSSVIDRGRGIQPRWSDIVRNGTR